MILSETRLPPDVLTCDWFNVNIMDELAGMKDSMKEVIITTVLTYRYGIR